MTIREYIINPSEGIGRRVAVWFAMHGDGTIADIAKSLNISVPTITKAVGELIGDGIVTDLGKAETAGGRRPNIFALAGPGVNFLGVGVNASHIYLIISDLRNNIVSRATVVHALEDTEKSVENILRVIEKFIAKNRTDIVAAGIALPGRVDPARGRSHSWFGNLGNPLGGLLAERLGMPAYIDNCVRTQCLAEHTTTDAAGARNVIHVDLGVTASVAIVADGRPYLGHSGLAGEFDHTPVFGADIEQTVAAARRDDPAATDIIEAAAAKAGRTIATLIDLLNPELTVVGGPLAQAGDYLMLPLQAAVHKHAPKLPYHDTRFRPARLEYDAGAFGAAITARNKTLGI